MTDTSELQNLERLFEDLLAAPRHAFPAPHGHLDAPATKGVYVIYDSQGNPAHVGMTPSGAGGLKQRLTNHLTGKSSFKRIHLDGKAETLRQGYQFQCLPVSDYRTRALLEAYAIGHLCPAHIGRGGKGE